MKRAVIYTPIEKLKSMKKGLLYTLAIAAVGFGSLTSCNKDKEPAVTMAGTYSGSFEGTYMEHDTLTSNGYAVTVTAVNDNKVEVSGNDFETFEVLVTNNGLNVEPVSQSDPYLTNFIYIGDESKLKFTYTKEANTGTFIGTK